MQKGSNNFLNYLSYVLIHMMKQQQIIMRMIAAPSHLSSQYGKLALLCQRNSQLKEWNRTTHVIKWKTLEEYMATTTQPICCMNFGTDYES
uniref:Uncharacterized protein n=1 Tax=Arundo donax TaxID=35708 RepID=A0A0A9AU43_ARUDO